MEVGPPGSPCRRRAQTTAVSCRSRAGVGSSPGSCAQCRINFKRACKFIPSTDRCYASHRAVCSGTYDTTPRRTHFRSWTWASFWASKQTFRGHRRFLAGSKKIVFLWSLNIFQNSRNNIRSCPRFFNSNLMIDYVFSLRIPLIPDCESIQCKVNSLDIGASI